MGGRTGIRAAVIGASLALVAGCGKHAAKQPAPPLAPKAAVVLPVMPRPNIDPDPAVVPAAATAPIRPPESRQLTATECRRLAVANAPFASDLDAHPDNKPIALHPWCKPSEKLTAAARMSAVARGHAADELRNRAAGEALEQFFQLAASEGQLVLVRRAQDELRSQLDQAEKAVAAGLHDRAGVDAIRGQFLGLEAQAAQVEANLGSLNIALRARLGVASNDPLPLWPDDPLHIRPDVVDADQAVRTGLLYRPDLNLLRSLLTADGDAGADVRQAVLGSVNPLLKNSTVSGLFAGVSGKKEQLDAAARRQIETTLAGRERLAEAEIRAAVSALTGHRAAAAARAAEVRLLAATTAELEKKQEQGVNVTAELTKARLDMLKAKGELLKTQADWGAAEAKLRLTMGLLVRE